MESAGIRTRQRPHNMQSEMFQWYRLPSEIRLLILDALQHQCYGRKPESDNAEPQEIFSHKLYHGLASYTSVCREWQAFFSKKIFHRLVLHQQDLGKFGNIIGHYEEFVKHIWLRIEIHRYDGRDYWGIEREPTTIDRDSSIFQQAIYGLFSILSSWKENHHQNNCGLTLEISLYSPGVLRSPTKVHRIHASFECADCPPDFGSENIHGTSFNWIGRQREALSGLSAVYAGDRGSFILKFGRKIPLNPSVSVVKYLLIRRQTGFRLGPKTLEQICDHLPGLESLHYEPWRRIARLSREVYDKGMLDPYIYAPGQRSELTVCGCLGFINAFPYAAPNTLKSLVIFEDFDHSTLRSHRGEYMRQSQLFRTPSQPLGVALARRSLGLEILAVSFLIDARDFLKGCDHSEIWPKLTSLALTSPLLSAQDSPEKISNLLLHAASAACRMPKLRTMELWCGGKGQASLFRYHTTPSSTAISWHGTWHLEFNDRVVQAWSTVALKYGKQQLRVEEGQFIDGDIINCHATATHHLQLKIRVVHPTSIQQIRLRTDEYYYS